MLKKKDRDYSFLFNDFVDMLDNLHHIKVPKDYIGFDRIYATKYTEKNTENKNSE
tara:strand:+ start:4292 stop:4456 length:165 start_codon:yes stop_codon:yes gene_type:complete